MNLVTRKLLAVVYHNDRDQTETIMTSEQATPGSDILEGLLDPNTWWGVVFMNLTLM